MNKDQKQIAQKCLFISIIGEPNVGKSTLLNRIAGQKISIVTHKVQTTRSNIRAVFSNIHSGVQLIFTDTPGIFDAKQKLERHIVSNAMKGIEGTDVAIVLIDAKRGVSDYMKQLLTSNKKVGSVGKKLAVINKIDEVDAARQFELIDELKSFGIFDDFFAISALKGVMVDELVQFLESCGYDMPWIYELDQVTDTNVREIAQEITREKVFLNLHKELPYSIKVETEKWDEDSKKVNIYQVIYVVRDSHKMIVLGKSGAKIKMIGQQSRVEISNMLEKRVNLFLHVKVRENWIDTDIK